MFMHLILNIENDTGDIPQAECESITAAPTAMKSFEYNI